MPVPDLDKLSRRVMQDGRDFVILRPGIALVLYSDADFPTIMQATANVLQAYLHFVQQGAIAAKYEGGPDEYTPGRWIAFDSITQAALLDTLRSATASSEEEGYGFELIATPDGQAGRYGVKFGGINLAHEDARKDETSLLRLEFPRDLFSAAVVTSFLDFVDHVASMFPLCCGHAGLSFTYTLAYVPEVREEIDKLIPRFLGFDTGHTSMQLGMRGKTPPAHWLNLLGPDLIGALGGEDKLISELNGCEVTRRNYGFLIRAAKLPPVVDVNRGGLDIGCLPTVAKTLRPLRFDQGLFVALRDSESGQAWLQRFDNLESRDWDNS